MNKLSQTILISILYVSFNSCNQTKKIDENYSQHEETIDEKMDEAKRIGDSLLKICYTSTNYDQNASSLPAYMNINVHGYMIPQSTTIGILDFQSKTKENKNLYGFNIEFKFSTNQVMSYEEMKKEETSVDNSCLNGLWFLYDQNGVYYSAQKDSINYYNYTGFTPAFKDFDFSKNIVLKFGESRKGWITFDLPKESIPYKLVYLRTDYNDKSNPILISFALRN